MPNAIELAAVNKTFGTTVAVRDMDMIVPRGGLYGFIGPNGAGKTTTIRMIMSILFPDSGRISVLGPGSALEAKDRIGYMPEERGVYKKMRVGNFLRYMARLKGYEKPDLSSRVRGWLEQVELPDVENKPCEELSKGMQQKLQFITAVLQEPDLLILDEPFSGLDPVNMRLLRDLIREQHKRGATIIFSTHVMYQAEQLCDHILMINDGQKVLDETLTSIRTKYDPRAILFEPLDPHADLEPIRSLAAVQSVVKTDGSYQVSLVDGSDVGPSMQQIVAAVPTARIEIHRPTLEDVFVRIVNESRGASEVDLEKLRTALRDDASAVSEEIGA